MNLKNMQLVIDKIESDPACWDQSLWHCKTTHCFFGLAQIMSGRPVNNESVRRDARIFLGMNLLEANYFASTRRTLQEFKDAISNRDGSVWDEFDRKGFDHTGFNRMGFDQEGFNRGGFNRGGFNRMGFDWDGFNREGFNWAGFDREGYDREGFDRDGFNRGGFNRAGFNQEGYDQEGFDMDGLNRNNNPRDIIP